MTLAELISELRERAAGRTCLFSWLDRPDGTQLGAAKIDGKLFATWQAELENAPVFDGVTPRGPARFHSLRFFDGPAGEN